MMNVSQLAHQALGAKNKYGDHHHKDQHMGRFRTQQKRTHGLNHANEQARHQSTRDIAQSPNDDDDE